jgi:uncharacterized sulfatase
MTRLLAALLFVVACRCLPAAAPNVLYIISDDQAWTDYGFMGHETIKTPHLDRLASQSAVFPRGYVPDSLCRPSLATLITGLYPHQHKISGNDPRHGGRTGSPRRAPESLRLNAEYIRHIEAVPTLPRRLADKGYLSLQTGKWWEGDYGRGGFTHGMTHGDPARGGRHGDEGLKIGREGLQPIYDFITEAGDKPWLVWYAPFLPHSPHNPPERLLQKYVAPDKSIHVARYQAMCEWFDETCGELLEYLDDQGLADNTLVVYVTDNGWIQNPDSPQYAPRSKRSQYDGGVRTPIMLRWPGRIAAERYEETLVSSVDLVPTILSAAGVAPPESLPGLNLLDVCAHGGKSGRDTVYGAIFEHDVPDIHDPAAGLMHRWCIGGWWKLIVPADGSQETELYDLQTDPHELKNVANEKGNLEIVTALREKLDAWWSPDTRGGKADEAGSRDGE